MHVPGQSQNWVRKCHLVVREPSSFSLHWERRTPHTGSVLPSRAGVKRCALPGAGKTRFLLIFITSLSPLSTHTQTHTWIHIHTHAYFQYKADYQVLVGVEKGISLTLPVFAHVIKTSKCPCSWCMAVNSFQSLSGTRILGHILSQGYLDTHVKFKHIGNELCMCAKVWNSPFVL